MSGIAHLGTNFGLRSGQTISCKWPLANSGTWPYMNAGKHAEQGEELNNTRSRMIHCKKGRGTHSMASSIVQGLAFCTGLIGKSLLYTISQLRGLQV